ncbi:secondary thiamine-phosphate synthase enzyme YjbQ [Flavobacteriaceae bacterium]|nr:secondary thiamine-phosphate synthase enzyme YjbQ [Flavobacteriaceae bacterium]MDA8947778.1 secondary thiamine-phosphate synthase enzyme YjbQ [Flavobacteriaceae bacterium]MDA9016233.1 secondary thiamine-phosphate synthase enzyme YjbQ [Flavobacteriaceae bacterium]MDB3862762.1 secondary thiamine-phosphate synthase enzyme YjbQ [Flavobacteriaceae bacterium]
MVFQKKIQLPSYSRGFHLITQHIVNELPKLTGIVQVFIQHTSASLTINENADPTVRVDFETFFNQLVSEESTTFLHTDEGPDDMTSHIKSSMLGSSISFPVKQGVPQWGIWQGIYLCEHRNTPRRRNLVITAMGEKET